MLSALYIKAAIRPHGADRSVEAAIIDDGTWVSAGTFDLRYTCLDPDADPSDLHSYDKQTAIHILAGYHYQVGCTADRKRLTLENIGWQDVDYHTFAEAIYEVPEQIRWRSDLTAIAKGFAYEHYNDWGNADDVQFSIKLEHNTKLLHARLDEYKGSVMLAAGAAFEKGVRTEEAMMKALAPKVYKVSSMRCPELTNYYSKLRALFVARLVHPVKGPEKIYLDSPDVYHYYMDNGADAMVAIHVLEAHDALYKMTQEVMAYVRSCAIKPEENK